MTDAKYLAASSMSAIERMLETSTYNTVNAGTPGFQRQRVLMQSFGSFLEDAGHRAELIGAREMISFEQGDLQSSEQPFAVALEGDGFFVVKGDEGKEYLTRNGDFVPDAEGRLRSRAGFEVVGEGGALLIDPAGGAVSIGPEGTLVQGERELGRLKLVDVASVDRAKLSAASETMYLVPEGVETTAATAQVRHGFLEMPRHTGVQGMVEMLIAKKNHESIHRALQALDETQNRLIDAVQ